MENEEIDLIEVVTKLWHRKRVIVLFMLIFLTAGVITAFVLPKQYTAECKMGLEVEDKTMRISVEGLSAFQSANMGDVRNTRIISPAMYPDILFSVPFQKELIHKKILYDEAKDSISFYDYFIATHTVKDTGISEIQGAVEQLSPGEEKCLEYLKKQSMVEVNNKDGYLKLSVDMPEPHVAALIAQQMQVMLQSYITKFKVAKAQANLDFLEERYREMKKELENKQEALIHFRESNRNSSSAYYQTEGKILNNDYELFFELYSGIVRQREKAKIQVKEDMPVLTVIEPVVLPSAASKPQRGIIIIVSLCIGLIAGCGWILLSDQWKERRISKK